MQQFTCEICGGAEYWGRRAFERHFKEWRHQNGMRALGIPNNKNFFEVTQISDARELWTSIQVRLWPCHDNQDGHVMGVQQAQLFFNLHHLEIPDAMCENYAWEYTYLFYTVATTMPC